MIRVESEIDVYEVNGSEELAKEAQRDNRCMFIKSHWNQEKLVRLKLPSGEVTVGAADLLAAVRNATNTNRFG